MKIEKNQVEKKGGKKNKKCCRGTQMLLERRLSMREENRIESEKRIEIENRIESENRIERREENREERRE